MWLKKRLALPLCGLLLLSGCAVTQGGLPSDSAMPDASPSGDSAGTYLKITAEEGQKMIAQGDVTIVDVRTAEEYAQARIPGALLVPNESIGDELPDALPDQEATLIVYCRTGRRSKEAADKLLELGYQKVYDMGGIVDWPYETESGETAE